MSVEARESLCLWDDYGEIGVRARLLLSVDGVTYWAVVERLIYLFENEP